VLLTSDVRRQLLSQVKTPENEVAKQKLYYRGATQTFGVYRIDLDWLIYNRHNGRLEAEMLTWQQEHSLSPEHYDDALHKLIEDFLWNSNKNRNKQTLEDLKEKQQQRPGIVSLDGVIIDGNRRAMLLRKLEGEKKVKQYFDAIILPDSYDKNEKEIVRLETQYQLGEDAKVEYGPLQKYLHARRLNKDLNISVDEIDKLMGAPSGNTKKLLEIMNMMDDYLEHIGCAGLYTMLKDSDGTKEGMFVDLHSDLKKINSGKARIPWSFDPDVDPLLLRLIQFDYIRLGEFADAKKTYREISHGKGNFFSYEDIWESFRDKHQNNIFPAAQAMGSLEDFMEINQGFDSKVDAAKARDSGWKTDVKAKMQENFGKSSYSLSLRVNELKPKEHLERAKMSLQKIDIVGPGLLSDAVNFAIVVEINMMTYEMKKKFERAH
jgi:hypothetical protein